MSQKKIDSRYLVVIGLMTMTNLVCADDQIEQIHDKVYNKARFEAADTNRDGFLSRQEAAANMRVFEGTTGRQRFDAADTNNDGLLSLKEAKAYKQVEKEDRGPALKKRQDKQYSQERFEAADANGDGFVSLEEANADKLWIEAFGGAKRFKMADSNGDGKLSFEEAMQQKRREREEY